MKFASYLLALVGVAHHVVAETKDGFSCVPEIPNGPANILKLDVNGASTVFKCSGTVANAASCTTTDSDDGKTYTCNRDAATPIICNDKNGQFCCNIAQS
ncbi:hypothetical protein AX774_g7164 [Zancudomyces culisetae]|uniref:Uncharacterized protein n=1 Tax=Zancudomyces culisetae TaxID=1213189 RepID=A0A1R1PEP4_ZANCU|nr:hypothetical protein AX774_g7164 [Zancudomyces culisetae]|eukprot:OMH79431.1 hypothetical protein AX774_g7164 [Zancudomyces culisetae]